MKMISFAVKKGGVGKTTLCKNIAYKLALENKKVLLVDLDPQATLSMQFFTDKIYKNKSIIKLFNGRGISLKNIIQNTNFNNIDIIVGNEEINKSTTLINTLYNEEEKYLVADYIFKDFQEIFDSYDYVLIDYPPTMQELALNFLIISDLVVIPINNGIGSYKGLLDLKNSLNHICRKENREVPKLKIILNNVKEDEDTILIYKTLEKENLTHFLSKNFINHSRSFFNFVEKYGWPKIIYQFTLKILFLIKNLLKVTLFSVKIH